jgi:hypothetical protein
LIHVSLRLCSGSDRDEDIATMASVRVGSFSPGVNGFPFANYWPHIPMVDFNVAGLRLGLGDAANGLCGGMTYAAADLYIAGIPASGVSQPEAGTAAYGYLVRRQIESFAGAFVPLRLLTLMRTSRPERESRLAEWLGWLGIAQHSRSWIMAHQNWPRVQRELDAGRFAALTLQRVVDDDPLKMNQNHQVLAYGYDLDGTIVTLYVYDPNWPGEDVTLRFDVADPRAQITTTYSKPDAPVVCFFRTPYMPVDPAPWR